MHNNQNQPYYTDHFVDQMQLEKPSPLDLFIGLFPYTGYCRYEGKVIYQFAHNGLAQTIQQEANKIIATLNLKVNAVWQTMRRDSTLTITQIIQ